MAQLDKELFTEKRGKNYIFEKKTINFLLINILIFLGPLGLIFEYYINKNIIKQD